MIRSKNRMYELLEAGAFGNTIPQWFDIDRWEASADASRYPVWGVRTLIPGGPCRLNCPREEVRATAERQEFREAGVNISVMVDAAVRVTLWADVYDSETGLLVYGIERPPKGGSWRALMPSQGREWRGLSAQMILRRHLNANSLADLEALRERWPGHVYELSACDRCFGTVPGRNAVLWEVRNY
ncbi:MAG TPA: hypothetical protein VD948_11785 [Rhodothermales bacterium]|nr:hypothetical protein [Rhodothermales bacterium]